MPWFDSHCHLEPDTAADDIAAARDAGVARLVTIGTDAAHSAAAIAIAAGHDDVWATVGLHPHDARHGIDTIVALLDEPGIVAVGECGLDYHYDHSPRTAQREAFAAQIAMAHERGLALVIHTREAWDDTFAILRAEGVPERTIVHCFTGGPVEARQCLDLGTYLSFSGIVSFPSAGEVREAARLCPPDRFLVETDAPYLAPVPHRGRRNHPALVTVVGAAVAEARGEAVADVAACAFVNAGVAFGLD